MCEREHAKQLVSAASEHEHEFRIAHGGAFLSIDVNRVYVPSAALVIRQVREQNDAAHQ